MVQSNEETSYKSTYSEKPLSQSGLRLLDPYTFFTSDIRTQLLCTNTDQQ